MRQWQLRLTHVRCVGVQVGDAAVVAVAKHCKLLKSANLSRCDTLRAALPPRLNRWYLTTVRALHHAS